jgi:hypothetical protein
MLEDLTIKFLFPSKFLKDSHINEMYLNVIQIYFNFQIFSLAYAGK